MSIPERYAELVTNYSRIVIVVLLVASAVVGSAAGSVDGGLTIAEFASDSTEAQKLDYVNENFSTEGENTTTVQVVVRGENVLSKESLLASLEFQRSLRENASVNATLREDRPTVGLANLVAIAAIYRERAGGGGGPPGSGGGGGGPPGGGAGGQGSLPSLDAQIEQLESMSADEVEDVVAFVLDPDREASGIFPVDPYAFLPTDYEPGSTSADARITFVFQATGEGELSDEVVAAQVTTKSMAQERFGPGNALTFGAGIVDTEATQATGDSFAVLTPIAFLLVLVALLVAYRDPLDVVLGLAGIVLVLVWMGGFMGWAGIGVTQIIIAVPFLLIGLSIDYALHVVMRYREARAEARERGDGPGLDPRTAMRRGLAGVVVAIGAATFTTTVGFFSNLVSPIGSIQEFGLVSGVGILAAFVVFGGLLPAVKVELDRLLAWAGLDYEVRAFGTGSGPVNRLLGVGAVAARKAPVAVVLVALLVSAGGAYGATQVDTSLDQVDFLPRDSPDWMDELPAAIRPGDYTVRESAIYLNDNFLQDRDRTRVEILVEGPVTDPGTLDALDAGRDRVAETESALTLADGEPRVQGPTDVIRRTAAQNETVAAIVERSDTDGDGVPDENLGEVYDAVYAANPEEASSVIYRDGDGDYRAVRVTVSVTGGADTATITREMRSVATEIESGTGLTATATGRPIINEIVQKGLLRTLVETFLITLGVILAFLTATFYSRYRTLTLGAVTMVPVVFALSWILGTMYLLGVPFTTETAIIASIAIGLGVDYAIHVSERFVEELAEGKATGPALRATLAGTGGALLASAVTTAAGFGSLGLALVPSLQRFGLVTGVTIVYAFVACVVVLPSLLALWNRYVATGFGSVDAGSAGVPRGEPSD